MKRGGIRCGPAREAADRSLLVRCADGRLYDFTPYAKARSVAGVIAEAFSEGLSTSEEPETRNDTNRTRFGALSTFLRWACRQRGAGILTLNLTTLKAYLQWLLSSEYAPTSVVSLYGAVSGSARALMRVGTLPPFIVPTGISQQEARTFSKGSRTLADLVSGGVEGVEAAQLDEHLLKELLKVCDGYARELEAQLELGVRWRSEVRSGTFAPPIALLSQPYSAWRLERLGMVEVACKLALTCWDGNLPSKPRVSADAHREEVQLFHAILWGKGAWGLEPTGSRP